MENPGGGERPEYQVLKLRTIGWISVIVVAAGIGLAAWLILAYGRGEPRDSLEAIKTAGAIVIGSGGAVALWLAARRRRTTEIALKQKDLELEQRDRDQQHTVRDDIERRMTELYTMAANQLGSDKAPVRLAGMYGLERLAQSSPDQRQTVVNVLCAYLRMSSVLYEECGAASSELNEAVNADNVVREGEKSSSTRLEQPGVVRSRDDTQREQEWQVRLTVQRIIAMHLRPGQDPAAPVETFWTDIDLDLTGATLLDFDLSQCHIRAASFDGARFRGTASFGKARFSETVSYREAQFGGEVKFMWAQCAGTVSFTGAQFSHAATFDQAEFSSYTSFDKARFGRIAHFEATRFDQRVVFCEAEFAQLAVFNLARFTQGAEFGLWGSNGARFGGTVLFRAAQFDGHTIFKGTTFAETVVFDDAKFCSVVVFDEVTFGGSAVFSETKFVAKARFRNVKFRGKALFRGSEFGQEADFSGALFGAYALFAEVRFRIEASCLGARARVDVPEVADSIWPIGWLLAKPPSFEMGHLHREEGCWGRLFDR